MALLRESVDVRKEDLSDCVLQIVMIVVSITVECCRGADEVAIYQDMDLSAGRNA